MGRAKTDYFAFLPLIFIAVFCTLVYLKNPSPASSSSYEPVGIVASATLADTTLNIPSWSLFQTGQLWSLVSPAHKLSADFTPNLVATTVAHSPGADKVGNGTEKPLEALFAGASASGVKLMLSSAYRSASDQQATYDSLLALHGKDYVHEYVAAPGASEHQTGLAVDIATVTHGCELDANACSLDAGGIEWLRVHAADYGFIERYPSGKQSITGVAGEHWHYRYVGLPLAKALTKANMTLDEFVQQIATGYSH